MGRFKWWILFGGIGLGVYGFKEWRLASVAHTEPQAITCEALARDGYGENAHVRIGEFLMSPTGFVYETKRGATAWKSVYVPLLPLHGPYAEDLRALPEGAEMPAPTQFGVILKTAHAANAEALVQIGESEHVQGVVINEIASLDSESKKLLRDSYPGIDLDACWIVEHKRTVSSAVKGLGILLGGLALVFLAGFFAFRKKRAADA